MYHIIKNSFGLIALLVFLTACGGTNPGEEANHMKDMDNQTHGSEDDHHQEEGVHFSQDQFNALQMVTGKLPRRNISAIVEANGELDVKTAYIPDFDGYRRG